MVLTKGPKEPWWSFPGWVVHPFIWFGGLGLLGLGALLGLLVL